MRLRGFDVDGPNGLFPMPTEPPSTLGLCSRRSKTETPATRPPKTRTSPIRQRVVSLDGRKDPTETVSLGSNA
jgi:hypothetical protein